MTEEERSIMEELEVLYQAWQEYRHLGEILERGPGYVQVIWIEEQKREFERYRRQIGPARRKANQLLSQFVDWRVNTDEV